MILYTANRTYVSLFERIFAPVSSLLILKLSAKLSSCLSCTVCLYTESVLGVGGVIHKMQRRLAGGENRRRSFRLTVF